MDRKPVRTTLRTGLLLLALSLPAMAELGGSTSSVHADQQRLRGALRVNAGQIYAIHEIQIDRNNVVREFVSKDGKVFAVAYHGESIGQGNEVLGRYSTQISQAIRGARKGRVHQGGPLILRLPGLYYQASGHMRSYHIRAYVPENVPQGVNLEELR